MNPSNFIPWKQYPGRCMACDRTPAENHEHCAAGTEHCDGTKEEMVDGRCPFCGQTTRFVTCFWRKTPHHLNPSCEDVESVE